MLIKKAMLKNIYIHIIIYISLYISVYNLHSVARTVKKHCLRTLAHIVDTLNMQPKHLAQPHIVNRSYT